MVQNDPVHAGIPASILSGIADVAVGTLNVWVARGLVPGVSTGTQGRARFFDLDATIHVTIMTALVRQGYAAPDAAEIAHDAGRRGWSNRGIMAIKRIPHEIVESWEAPSWSELDRCLEDPGGRPEVFIILEIGRIVERVRAAFIDPTLVPKAAFLEPRFEPDC
jgi:hypothetical protein